MRSGKLIPDSFDIQSCKFAFEELVPSFSGPFGLPRTIWESPHRRKREDEPDDAGLLNQETGENPTPHTLNPSSLQNGSDD